VNNWFNYLIGICFYLGALQIALDSKAYFFIFLLLSPFIFGEFNPQARHWLVLASVLEPIA